MSSQPAAKHWKSSQLMTGRSFEINLYRDKDFKTISMHSHDFYELYFFIQGRASYIVEDGNFHLESGDILLISPSNLHQLNIADSSLTYERIVLWLNPKYISKLSTSKTNLALCFDNADQTKHFLIRDKALSDKIKAELLSLYYLSSQNTFGDDILSENHIKNILLLLCRHSQAISSLDLTEDISFAKQNLLITKVMEYINQRLTESLTLDTLAEQFFVSKYHLAHTFKAETGTTPHQYILKKRLILSKQLIEQGLTITEVYVRCGFADYTHYFRAFKQEYGITPKQYFTLIKR